MQRYQRLRQACSTKVLRDAGYPRRDSSSTQRKKMSEQQPALSTDYNSLSVRYEIVASLLTISGMHHSRTETQQTTSLTLWSAIASSTFCAVRKADRGLIWSRKKHGLQQPTFQHLQEHISCADSRQKAAKVLTPTGWFGT